MILIMTSENQCRRNAAAFGRRFAEVSESHLSEFARLQDRTVHRGFSRRSRPISRLGVTRASAAAPILRDKLPGILKAGHNTAQSTFLEEFEPSTLESR